MTRQWLSLQLVSIGCRIVNPDLDEVVAATSHEASVASCAGAGRARDDGAGGSRGGPGDGVDAQAVGGEAGVVKVVVFELDDRDVAVGRGARQQAAGLVGGPGHDVDRGLVQGKVEDARPCALLLAPDEDLAVVA